MYRLNLFSFVQNIKNFGTPRSENYRAESLIEKKEYPRVQRVALALAISIALLLTLWPWASMEEIGRILLGLDYFWVVISALSYILANLARAERFVALESEPVKKRSVLLWIVCLHGFFNHILPMRLGELTFLHYSRKYRKLKLAQASSYLMMARYLDIGALIVIVIVCAMLSRIDEIRKWSGIIGIPVLALWFCFGFTGNFISRYLALWLIRKGRSKKRLKQKIFIALGMVACEIARIKKRTLMHCFFWSVVTWLCIMMCMYFGLLATRNFFPPEVAILGASGAILTTLLPINTSGTIGTYEVGWAIGYSKLGMPIAEAVATGLVVHLLLLVYTSMLALISRMCLIRSK
jgi:uncharacterized membrane protein YbhN (UPF0104 family)